MYENLIQDPEHLQSKNQREVLLISLANLYFHTYGRGEGIRPLKLLNSAHRRFNTALNHNAKLGLPLLNANRSLLLRRCFALTS